MEVWKLGLKARVALVWTDLRMRHERQGHLEESDVHDAAQRWADARFSSQTILHALHHPSSKP